ncbi:hypothetical protein [Thioalkalivibrio nitratireducens]|uniref:hypothetical protein n=1 Tax=Thioalkalivibrio nitratireducens TaxID=186931 RepID=UPI0012EE9D8E|nr:hypothetical protein [Thioalkalivibrio nitratireducens]
MALTITSSSRTTDTWSPTTRTWKRKRGPEPSELEADESYWEQQDLGRAGETAPDANPRPAPTQEPARDPGGRREAIVQWLAESRVSRPLRNGDGFYVLRGKYGRLTDGAVVEMLAWLGEEGIVAGTLVGGYSVAYTPPGGPYLEKLTFFRIIERVPFSRLAPSQPAVADPDLPF